MPRVGRFKDIGGIFLISINYDQTILTFYCIMEQTPFVPPKSCLICSTAMQTTKTDERIIHECGRCGMSITIVLPAQRGKKANGDTAFR